MVNQHSKTSSDNIEAERAAGYNFSPRPGLEDLPDTKDDSLCNVRRLRAEIKWLRGIIARNAMQYLNGEACVTPDDIKDSLEVLYTWQRENTPDDNIKGNYSE